MGEDEIKVECLQVATYFEPTTIKELLEDAERLYEWIKK
jgi:hypothetical protein